MSASWSETLRAQNSTVANEFNKANSYQEHILLAQKLSYDRDRNQSPAVLQNLYIGEMVHKTYRHLQEKREDKLERLRNKYGAASNLAQLDPFALSAFDDDDNDKLDPQAFYSTAAYKYSQRLTNVMDKKRFRRLRTLPNAAYCNHHLWSAKSINLEEQMRHWRPFSNICLEKFIATLDKIESGMSVAFVDTMWAVNSSTSGTIRRESLGRVSIFTQSMLRFDSSLMKVSIL
jgi:hypothetical protein